jgi:spore coat protein CotH
MTKFLPALFLLTSTFAFSFCTNKSQSSGLPQQSHGKYANPDYSIVFPNDKVNRIDIKIDTAQWNEMMVDLKSNIGFSGGMQPRPGNDADRKPGMPHQNDVENPHQQRSHQGPPPGGMGMRTGMENDSIPSQNREQRMGPPPGGRPGGAEYEPIWASCNILFNNETWSKVGIRFKGNSSLRSAYQSGINKLSFKLDFEQFENEFPEIENQRFYGFKQLNLKNNYDDKSFVREKVASDLFADFGLVSPKTSFYQLFVDYGDGPVYFGLYTLVEEVDNTVIETGFSSENGSLYKPEGRGATFAKNSFRATDMNKKTNKKSKDYSDVEQLNTVINSSSRLENHELWKAQLSEIFDVPVFLKWLAANTVMQNWDSYGKTFHNYYLYNNPSTNKLVWIPWDNNEAFQRGKMGGAPSLSLNEVGENWPLIRYILDDEAWNNEYKLNVAEFSEKYFNPERMNKTYSNYQQLLAKNVIGEEGEKPKYTFLENETDFTEAIGFLKQHVNDRNTAVQEFLSK